METCDNSELANTPSQALGSCLATPVILRQVLEQFSNMELIQLSLVNKQWNFEARSVLRDRGTLRAKMPWYDACKSLGNFASDLEQMSVVPYSGIIMVMDHTSKCISPAREPLDPVYTAILDRLPCKRLKVKFWEPFTHYQDCSALLFVKNLLNRNCGVLQQLTLHLHWEVSELLKNVIQHSNFPRLRTLNIQANSRDAAVENFLKTLVSCAPSLQDVKFWGDLNFAVNILEGSSAVLVPTSEFHPLKDQVCESLICALRPKNMTICGYETEELLNRYIPRVLEASRPSLTTLEMNLLFAVPLMCYGVCLDNLTKLVIKWSSDSLQGLQPRILKLLGKFDFTRVFPKLTCVRVYDSKCNLHFSLDGISGFVERGHAVLRHALPDRAINIQHLSLTQFSEFTGPLLPQMFPHVKKLTLDTCGKHPFPFRLIWEHFANLEELLVNLTQCRPCAKASLDNAFCGIFPEEVAELMEKDVEYLKAVNIVPVMPSICSMRNLKTFKLGLYVSYDLRVCEVVEKVGDPTLFTEVTGLVGFARCPSLSVTLKTSKEYKGELAHMEPYVSLIIERYDNHSPF